jgi:hypothetical protein
MAEIEVTTGSLTHKTKGVYRTSWGNKWFSQIRKDGKLYYLGTFKTQEDAAQAFSDASVLLTAKDG